MKKSSADYNQLIDWAEGQLQADILETEQIVLTAYSYVLRLKTDKGIYYLKKVPAPFFSEVETLRLLRQNVRISFVPKVDHYSCDHHCFLMESRGHQTVRRFFNGCFDMSLFQKGLEYYKKIQKISEGFTNDFLAAGACDWRMYNLPTVYSDFLADTAQLELWGMDEDLQKTLRTLEDKFEILCKVLDQTGIQPTLNHSDFHDNNIVIDTNTKELCLIDWGETNISHPFLSLESCFYNIVHRYNISYKSDDYAQLRHNFFAGWDMDSNNRRDIDPILQPLAAMYYVFTYKDLLQKAGYSFPKAKVRIQSALNLYIHFMKSV